MSKKLLVTSLAALSLSLFSGQAVLAETDTAGTEPRVTETGVEDQNLEQLQATAQSLLARLETLLANEASLPVSPENRQFLDTTIDEVTTVLRAMVAQGASQEDIQSLADLRISLIKLYLLQYEAVDLYQAITTQVPTLEDKRYDDAVDFHDFDAELDDLLAKTAYLSQILNFVQAELDPEELAKDQAYLNAVATYLLKLQEELYAPEGEVVEVPEAPVYWNADDQTGADESETDGSTETSDPGSTTDGSTDSSDSSSEGNDSGDGSDSGSTTDGSTDSSDSSSEGNDSGGTSDSDSHTDGSTDNSDSSSEGNDSDGTSDSDSNTDGSTDNSDSSSEGNDSGGTSDSDSNTDGSTDNSDSSSEGNGSGSATNGSNQTSETNGSTETSGNTSGSNGVDVTTGTSTNSGTGGAILPNTPVPTLTGGAGSGSSVTSGTTNASVDTGKQSSPTTQPAGSSSAATKTASLPATGDQDEVVLLSLGSLLSALGLFSLARRRV